MYYSQSPCNKYSLLLSTKYFLARADVEASPTNFINCARNVKKCTLFCTHLVCIIVKITVLTSDMSLFKRIDHHKLHSNAASKVLYSNECVPGDFYS